MMIFRKLVVSSVLLTLLSGCYGTVNNSSSESSSISPTPSSTETIPQSEIDKILKDPVDLSYSKKLSSLRVAGRAPMTGYNRTEKYGPAWKDVDHNGCDTRNDILKRDLKKIVYLKNSKCTVYRGILNDPYTGKTINFIRGVRTSLAVQIDHVVPLADSWQKGAQKWTQEKRELFANDPINLMAVDGPTNSAKGAGDAATWLPPMKSYRCTYIKKQIDVKYKYGVWITKAEKTALEKILSKC